MPLDFICRFTCNHCGTEHGDVGRVSVEAWPIKIESFAILQPPPGWKVDGLTALCPEHATAEAPKLSIVKPSATEITAALKGH